MTTAALLGLLQLSDSAFPAGGFTNSLGLEQLAAERRPATSDDVERYVVSMLRLSTATADAAATAIAARAAAACDLAPAVAADHALHRSKAASELRGASTAMGLRLLQEFTATTHAPTVQRFFDDVRSGRTPGTHAVAFGVAAGSLGVAPVDAAAALMLTTATTVLQASLRLLPVSHRDVQRTLHRLRPNIDPLATAACETSVDQLSSFHPMQDIAAMRHRLAPVRMFAS